jgi:hypothetical protein
MFLRDERPGGLRLQILRELEHLAKNELALQ